MADCNVCFSWLPGEQIMLMSVLSISLPKSSYVGPQTTKSGDEVGNCIAQRSKASHVGLEGAPREFFLVH